MTNSMYVDILINPISSNLKLIDANKNSIKENNKKRDNKEYDGLKEILIFLFG